MIHDPSLPLSEPRNNNRVKRLVSPVTPSQWGHCRVLCVTQLLASTKLRSVSGVTSLTQTHPCILFARASFVTGNGSLTNSGYLVIIVLIAEDTLYHASHLSLLVCEEQTQTLKICMFFVWREVRDIPEF